MKRLFPRLIKSVTTLDPAYYGGIKTEKTYQEANGNTFTFQVATFAFEYRRQLNEETLFNR